MSDTDKCPKCGSDITYHGTARPAGGGQVARCYNCGFAAEKTLIEEQIVVAAKHRIRELEARCETMEAALKEIVCNADCVQALIGKSPVRSILIEKAREALKK